MVNEDIEFNASLSYDPDGIIVEYHWEFGDGSTVSEVDPITVHSYGFPGCYVVNLTVTDDDGMINTTSKCVAVGCGDVNCDGEVDVSDIIVLYNNVSMGQEICSKWAADVNGDDSVDISDVIVLYQSISTGSPLNCKCLP